MDNRGEQDLGQKPTLKDQKTGKLIRLDWKGLDQQPQTDPLELQQTIELLRDSVTDNRYSPEQLQMVSHLVLDSIAELRTVLSIDKQVRVKMWKAKPPLGENLNPLARLNPDDDGNFSIELSGSFLQICLNSIERWEEETLPLAVGEAEFERMPEELLKKWAKELPALLLALAHEMYHARQADQDQQYFLRTEHANYVSQMLEKGLLKKGTPDPYLTDMGEKSANAFGIRYVKEKIKLIQQKAIKSPLEEILLLGYEREIEGEIRELAQRSKKVHEPAQMTQVKAN